MTRRAFLLALLVTFLLVAPLQAEGPGTHTVAWGETLYSIARLFKTDPQTLARMNNLPTNTWVYAGQILKVPTGSAPAPATANTTPSGYYTVRAGDTLTSIARQFGVDPITLADVNDIPDNGFVFVGWKLKIPGGAASSAIPAAPTKAPSTQAAAPAKLLTTRTHIVQAGESMADIALLYGTTPQAIAIANNLPTTWLVSLGQRLVVPSAPSARPAEAIPAAAAAAAINLRLTNIPLYRQKQTLTCEEAAAAMALRGAVSESQIVSALSRSDNPFVGIRGRTNSPTLGGLADYGIYAHGLQRGLSKLGRSSTILYNQSYADFKQAILSHLRSGRPVIWWNTWRDTYQTPVWVKVSGGSVKLVPYEHAVLIVGATDRGVIYHDPYDATIRSITWATHQRVSGYFNNMALVIN